MTALRRPRVVAIDAAEAAQALWRELAARPDLRVFNFDSRDATRDALRATRPDVVVLDWSVGCAPSGLPLLHALSIDDSLQRVPVVICLPSAGGSGELPATDESVYLLPKPFGLDELVDVISTALEDVPSDSPVSSHPD